jgi:hypothetical protein
MEPQNKGTLNLENELKAFRMMFVTIAGSIIVFAFVAFGLSSVKDLFIPALAGNKIVIAMAIVAGLSLFFAFRLYRNGILKLTSSGTPLQERIIAYRRVIVRFLALCEFPAMMAAVLFMLSRSFNLGLVIIICVAAILSKWPTKQKMENDLQLDWKEKQGF